MQFLPSGGSIDTAIWMHHVDAKKTYGEKKLDGNYTRILRALLNKSRRQHHTKQQLYGHLPPITKTIKIRRTRHAKRYCRSRDELVRHSCGPLHRDDQRQDVQLGHTYSSSVPILDVARKTFQEQWTIWRSGEGGSEISMLIAWHDDDDDNDTYTKLNWLNWNYLNKLNSLK